MTIDRRKVKIERFDGSKFGFWKIQIEDYMHQKKLNTRTLLDRQTLAVIRLSSHVMFAKEKTTT